MKKNYFVFTFLLISYFGFSQITFSGCHPLFEDQTYTFTNVGTDATGRHIFETTPIIGDNNCGGLGTCEFRLSWNATENRWEFNADSGNGDFTDPYLMFSNTNASTPNPPSLELGVWGENLNITEGECGGNLTTANAILTGDVQDETLSLEDGLLTSHIQLIPNPATNFITLSDSENQILRLEIYDISGKLVLKESHVKAVINVSNLPTGMYFVKLFGNANTLVKKLIKQ